MKNKAFTLIELMAVIVIISLVCLLTFPNIVNQINSGKDLNKNNIENIVVSAAKRYVNDNIDLYNEDNFCIAIDDLIENDYLKEDILSEYDISSMYVNQNYEISDKCELEN